MENTLYLVKWVNNLTGVYGFSQRPMTFKQAKKLAGKMNKLMGFTGKGKKLTRNGDHYPVTLMEAMND